MSDLKKICVNFPRRAQDALAATSERTGDNATDTVVRAVLVYGWVTARIAEGGQLVVRHPDGREETAVLL